MKNTVSEDYHSIVKDVNKFIALKRRLLTLKGIDKSSQFLTIMLVIIVSLVMFSFIVLLLTFALAYFIGELTGNIVWGFLFSSGINIIVWIIFILLRKKIITDTVIKTFSKYFLDDIDE